MKKKVCLMLALLMLASSMVACSDSGANTDPTTPSESVSGEVTDAPAAEETVVEEETESFDPGLPEYDFEGRPFNILTKAGWTDDWFESSIYTEEQNGEVLNDAVYERNLYINETYNTTITEIAGLSGSFQGDVQNAVTAGDPTYDVVMPPQGTAGSLGINGQLLDLNEVEHLNFEQKWWDSRSIDGLSIANKLFMVSGDISTLNSDATWCTMINLQVLEDFGFEKPYTYVANNKWTFDTYKTLCAGASIDLDGDGDFDSADSIANLTQNENATAMVICFGFNMLEKDEEDIPHFTMEGNERLYEVLTSLSDFMLDETVSLNYHNYGSEGYHLLTTKMFQENRGLFWITNLQMVIRLREMETDFGIAPCPKYDDTQETYSNVVWSVGSYSCIPLSAGSPKESGLILEAMAAKSREVLRPAYYETALSMKYLRDKESIEMLDLVIDNRTYDLELAFGFGVSNAVNSIVLNGAEPASTFASQKKAITKLLEKNIEKLLGE